jgi:translation initiation factor IF-3
LFPKKNFRDQPVEKENSIRINDKIKAYKVLLIDQNGNNLGQVTSREAIQKAREVSLDLVEVGPNSTPPIAKIMDFGKYVFEQKKKEKDNQHRGPVDKEIRLTPNIEIADLEVKVKKLQEFVEEGSRVTLSFKLRGRENKHQHRCYDVINKITELTKDYAIVENKGTIWIASKKQ